MLSKRDILLTRPWQNKRYDNHRRKVQSALPAIDNNPPPIRGHLLVKLKKRQQEIERTAKIEKDNFILLRKLGQIMTTNRVDNRWSAPPPNFSNRVALFQCRPSREEVHIEQIPVQKPNHIRKSKCSACTPKAQIPQKVPEQRVPWEPEKPPISRKRSQSVPAKRLSLPTITERELDRSEKLSAQKTTVRNKSCKANQRYPASGEECLLSPQSLVLVRGDLKLAINFPSDASIKMYDGLSERLVFGGDCYCSSMGKAY